MKHIHFIRGLGILCICSAAASFLFEGWKTFNGLEKFLSFFVFISALFLLGEAFKKSSGALEKIFTSLFLALSPAIAAQLGSFIIDGNESISFPTMFSPTPLPDGSPLKFICISSFIFLAAMVYRSVQRVKPSSLGKELIYFLSMQLLLIVPLRTSEFHATALLVMFLTFMLIEKKSVYLNLRPLVTGLIRLAPFLFLMGRAILYKGDSSLASALCLIISFVCFIYIPKYSKDKNLTDFSYAAGYLSVVILGHKLSNLGQWTDYKWTLIVVEALLILYIVVFKRSYKVGLFFMSIFAWFSFLSTLVTSNEVTLLKLTINILIPVAIIGLSYFYKYGFSLANSTVLLVVGLLHAGFRVIQWPVVNMWMVFGVLGITLLILSFVIENPHQKLVLFWNKTKSFFNQDF